MEIILYNDSVKDIIHLMSDPEGKTKLTGFPRDLTLSVCYISWLSLQQQQKIKNNRSEPKQSTRYL